MGCRSRYPTVQVPDLSTSGPRANLPVVIAPTLPHELQLALGDAVLAISAEHDLDDVLQLIADQARQLVGARYAAVGVPAPGMTRLERFVASGLTPEQSEAIASAPVGRGLLGVMLREGRPLHVPDIGRDPRSSGVPANHPPMNDLLGVPIRRGATVLGQLYASEKVAGDAFTAHDQAVLEVLARHAALAIAGARLVSRLSASESRYRLLTQGAPEIVFATDAAGRITFVNERTRTVTGFEPEVILGRKVRDVVLPEDRPVVDLHLRALANGAAHASFAAGAVGRDGTRRHFEVSLVPQAVPGSGYQGIALDVSERRAREREVAERTTEALASGEERERWREFVALVIQAQEEERARIAGDLHDTVVQTLTAIGRRLRVLGGQVASQPDAVGAELDEMAGAALAEAEEMRRLSRNLRPSVLDHLGLPAALQLLAEELRATGLTVDLSVVGDAARLADRLRTTLFRIAQEALTNVRRHSGARRVDVRLDVGDGEVLLIVADDGRGFDPADVAPRPHARTEHLGLLGMRERAALLGGTCAIDSQPGQGTRISVALPLDE